jgi:hypothetical protein
MDKHKPPAEDWVQELTRDFQDKLTCGLYDAIYQLDQGSVETLMRAQAHSCVGAFLELGTLRTPMSLDAFLDAMRIAGPSQIDIEREGNVIHWSEQHDGQCVCPFVRRGVVRLDPKLCLCGAHWVKELFRTVTHTEVDVEILETAATGARNCSFLITVQGPPDRVETP